MYTKGGILILGNKPMFDMDENIGVAVKAAIFETFGCYPIIYIHENYTIYDLWDGDEGESITLRDFSIFLDSEKVDLIDDFRMGYVTSLFEKIITAGNDGASELRTGASKKYCFSDTEDWWNDAKVDSFDEHRDKFTLEVEI